MKITVLGSGDAFGSGGRLQTSFHVAPGALRHEAPGALRHDTPDDADDAFLIDCGVTALMGLERSGLDSDRVATIFITHLHGDHFGGLVWWLIHAQHVARRTRPLTIAGPPGIEARFRAAADALYPGAWGFQRQFTIAFVELLARSTRTVGGMEVTAFDVKHPSGAPSYALRFECGAGAARRSIAFSGDTEWVESLRDAARGTDLFITECYGWDTPARYHLSWSEIERELPSLEARRVLLTHMGPVMLAHRHEISHPRVAIAEDGMVLDV